MEENEDSIVPSNKPSASTSMGMGAAVTESKSEVSELQLKCMSTSTVSISLEDSEVVQCYDYLSDAPIAQDSDLGEVKDVDVYILDQSQHIIMEENKGSIVPSNKPSASTSMGVAVAESRSEVSELQLKCMSTSTVSISVEDSEVVQCYDYLSDAPIALDSDLGEVKDVDVYILDQSQQEEELISNELTSDLTNRFLNGELTFSQYAAMMEGADGVEGNDDFAVSDVQLEVPQDRQEVTQESEIPSKQKKKRVRRRFPPALKGLMGEANLRFARGDHEMAIQICLEIIRQVPTAPEPFHTLAIIYDEMQCPDKSLQFALIAAHLSPNDVDQWVRLAELSEEQGNLKQAVTCLGSAIRANPTDTGPQAIDLYRKRFDMLERLGEKKFAIRTFMRLLYVLKPDQDQLVFQVARTVAQFYHETNELNKAREAMEVAFGKCPTAVTSEDTNLMLELLLNLKCYRQCLDILVQFCGIEIEAETEDSEREEPRLKILTCKIPPGLVIDLQVKFVVVMVHLGAFRLIESSLSKLMEEQDPEKSGDLYLDVAEALMSEGMYREALRLLTPLLASENYDLPAVWLRGAECLKECGDLAEAAELYGKVVTGAPQHLDARIALSELLRALGRYEDALTTLTQDPESEVLEPGLLYERCQLLKEAKGRTDEFLAVGQLLLSRHCPRIRNRDELHALTRMRRFEKKREALFEIRTSRGEPRHDPDAPDFHAGQLEPSVQAEWRLFRDMCEACVRVSRFDLLQRLAFSALGSKKFHSKAETLREIEFICLLACFYNGDPFYGYNFAREHILRDKGKSRLWNLFDLIIQRADDVRHNRFLMRLLARHPNHEALTVLHANNCLVAGTYKYALSEYATAYRNQDSAMTAFLIGVTLFQMACQKFSAKKHALVAQGLAFMHVYRKARGEAGFQETSYNLGRAFHQLGLLPAAIYNYKNALNFSSPLIDNYPHLLDLRREAAFNLYLIYHSSGAYDIARTYVEKYIIV